MWLGFMTMGAGMCFGERYAVAPMLDVTDRHFRTLCRMISRHATLYTEMAVDNALIRNEDFARRTLQNVSVPEGCRFGPGPVVLQLGGSDPNLMRQAAEVVSRYGGSDVFSAVNLNCGCPSDKVAGKGCFGASLMRTPELVAKICASIQEGLNDPKLPVTVKCRIGVDDEESLENLINFVEVVSRYGGVSHFVVHARKAILGGLNPKQNRTIPPLRYEYVDHLVEVFPNLHFSLNGGIKSLDAAQEHLDRGVHGVMVGRAVMDAPWEALAHVDAQFYSDLPIEERPWSRREILLQYAKYADSVQIQDGTSRHLLAKPILNLFHGAPRNRLYKRELSDRLPTTCSMSAAVLAAMRVLDDDVLDLLPGEKLARPDQPVGEDLRTETQGHRGEQESVAVME